MVRANCANTNAENPAPLSSHPPAGDRRSMHPSQPREAEWVARWLSGQRRARGTGEAGWAWAARRSPPARIPRRGRGAALTRSEEGDRSSADTGEPRRRVNDLPRQGPRAKTSGEDK
jgi:hypothetical protein